MKSKKCTAKYILDSCRFMLRSKISSEPELIAITYKTKHIELANLLNIEKKPSTHFIPYQ